MTVSTSFTALLPWSFDSPCERARMFTATSCTRRPACRSRRSASTSGAPLVYGCAMIGIALRFTTAIPLVGSRNGLPRRTCIAFWSSPIPNRREGEGR